MTDRLYPKFQVKRTDGRDEPGGDKEGARYFVLDYANDPKARIALAAYADAVADTEPGLAADLRALVADVVLIGRRVLTGREALTELLDKVVRRAVVEARSGAPGGMVAMYVAVETRHLLAGHGGDIKGCRPCTDEAVLLVASTGNAGW